MSTAIEWTDETWNPVTGCTKVSPGCDNCYAERVTERWSGPGSFEKVVLHPERLEKPVHWRKPRKVFVNSMSDLFHEDVPSDYIARVFGVMASCRAHTFQILTKRHGRMRSLLSRSSFRQDVEEHWARLLSTGPSRAQSDFMGDWWPLPNVWLGVSVEDQHWADIRIPALLDTPAAVRFLSCEPLIDAIDLEWAIGRHTLALNLDDCLRCTVHESVHGGTNHPIVWPIDWVIVGGESGSDARPMDPDWARALRDQCVGSKVPFLFKQWGGIRPKAGGRELDGRIWDEYPEMAES